MRNRNITATRSLKVNKSYAGESIETKVMRITINKEPIKDGAPLVYTDKKDGVLPEYDVRTDRFEIAIDAMDKVYKSRTAQREAKAAAEKAAKEPPKAELPKGEPPAGSPAGTPAGTPTT